MSPNPQRRLAVFAAGFAVGFAVLAIRLVFVHAIRPTRPDSSEDTIDRIARPAMRGTIYSADEKVLAWSEPRIEVLADPILLGTNQSRIRAIADLVVQVLGDSTNQLKTETLIPLLTAHPETRRWTTVSTNHWEPITNKQGRPLVDAANQPLVRPVIATNWWVNTHFTNRAVVLLPNITPGDWYRLRTNILALKFPEQEALLTVKTNLRNSRPDWRQRIGAAFGRDATQVKAWHRESRSVAQQLKLLAPELKEIRVNCLTARPHEMRIYPHGILAAHVLGYVTNDDRIIQRNLPFPLRGATGVEHMLDAELTGSPGVLITTRGARGKELVRLRERDVEAQDGLSVRLTIDTRLQAIVEDAVESGFNTLQPKSLTAIMIRPSTGEILAMANRPTYDPNRLREAPVEHRSNFAVVAPLEPGSTFKICTYATALDLGHIQFNKYIDCEGGRWSPGIGRPVNDTEGHGLGVVSYEEAFAHSSNVAAAKIGIGLSTIEFVQGMEKLGFLNRTGIFYRRRSDGHGGEVDDWGGEYAGSIPALNQNGRIGTELQGRLSFGYGLYVTPLQTAMAAAAIGNAGVLMKPQIIQQLRTPNGAVLKQFQPTAVRSAISPGTANAVLKAMRHAVTNGTGKVASLVDYEVAGKTGTAHKQFRGAQSKDKYLSTFVGLLPADHPELCILVLADETTKRSPGAHFGGRACGPIFTNIAQRAAGILALRPTAAVDSFSYPATPSLEGPQSHPTTTRLSDPPEDRRISASVARRN